MVSKDNPVESQRIEQGMQQSQGDRSDRMRKDEARAQVGLAARACMEKKAQDITILRLDASASGFTDYFLICSGANQRQVEAIAEAVDEKLSKAGHEPRGVEGRRQAEWILLDYVDFVVHIFSDSARKFYDLERLWKTATRLELADLEKPGPKKAAGKKPAVAKTVSRIARKTQAKRARTP
jgi:ribosome-associated protein